MSTYVTVHIVEDNRSAVINVSNTATAYGNPDYAHKETRRLLLEAAARAYAAVHPEAERWDPKP